MLQFGNKKVWKIRDVWNLYLKYNNSAYNIPMQYDFGL